MPGMASESRCSDGGGGGGGGESWFALKKDEFYVILDSVLTDMTKCDERNSVSGCIELIKLLSDDVTTSTAGNDQLSSRDGNRDTKLSDRLNPCSQSGNNNNRSGGYRGHSDDDTKGQISSCNKTFVNCRATGIRRPGDDDVQLGIRNGVDLRRHNLNKGNALTSATSLARRGGGPGIRDKVATSRLQRPGVNYSKEVVGYGRKTRLNGKTRDCLFHPNRIATNHGTQNIYSNSTHSDNQNAFNVKLSASRHQREIAKSHEQRLQNKSKPLCSAGPYYDDAQVNSNRPSTVTVYRRQYQSSHCKQNNPGLSAKTKAHNNLERNTTERTLIPTSVSSATEDQKSSSETNPRLELRSLTTKPFKLSQTVDRLQQVLTPKTPKSKWTPIDKAVINNILDDILNSDDSNSPLHTDLQTSRNNNDVNDDVDRSADDDGFLLPSDVKVEDESDVTLDGLGNNGGGVIANVKLVDVRRRFDVSQMSFKWKSQLLWRMRHDKVSQTALSSLCLT